MKKILLLAVIGAIIIFGYIIIDNYMESAILPMDIESEEYIAVEIPSGSTTKSIANILYDHGLIRNRTMFSYMSKKLDYDGKYQAGTYMLGFNMSMIEMMDTVYEGEVKNNTIRFTIPEGYNLEQVSQLLEEQGLIDSEVFFDEIANGVFDYKFIESLPEGENRLEGFLFPDTYEVYKDATEWDIINKMLKRFDELFIDEYYGKAEKMGFDVKEVITLASIIEREAMVDSERKIISSVFHNRLHINMKLQSCATVQYVLGEVKENLSTADTRIESPYNTYLHEGLPPGPISSPGIKSIKAALYPDETDYLYFVAKGDGSHAFAATYDKFLKYKRQYR